MSVWKRRCGVDELVVRVVVRRDEDELGRCRRFRRLNHARHHLRKDFLQQLSVIILYINKIL